MEIGDTVKLFDGTEDGFVTNVHTVGHGMEIYSIYSYVRKTGFITFKVKKIGVKIILLEKKDI